MDWVGLLSGVAVTVEYLLKVIALGVVPENRRPASSQAWLLLILFLPLVGFPLYWLIGSPYVRGRREKLQLEANKTLANHAAIFPQVPLDADPSPGLLGLVQLNQNLTALPCVTGTNHGLYDDTPAFYAAMASSVDAARRYVHIEFYIMAWDETTDVLFSALARAAGRGVKVRLLLDHLGSRKYPGWRDFQRRLTEAGIDWHLMMPILPLQGRWRRPDLRNHRKLMVVDGDVGYLGSHNVIDPHYGSRKNRRIGRTWKDLSVKVSGDIINELEAVFATDWVTETGEILNAADHLTDHVDRPLGGRGNAMQLVPSGPGFPTEPNHRMFIAACYLAERRMTIVSPYFIPDDGLLLAMTSASLRGVVVDLYVGEQADQFLVGHAQRSYYRVLLEAGVRIHLYPKPTVLHTKYLVVDDAFAAIGSSNMDYRSFALDYEIMLLTFGGDLVDELNRTSKHYYDVSYELTLEEWLRQPWPARWVDNVCKLTAAVM